MDGSEVEYFYSDLDPLYSFINILKITSNIDEFRLWLKEYHEIKNHEEIFYGYQFFIDVIICRIIDLLETNHSFKIESDYTLYRATFVGININNIPTTCEKTKFLKNIWNFYRTIRNCHNWKELGTQIETKNNVVIPIFDQIFSESIYSNSEIPKETVLLGKTLIFTNIYLNDTQKGYPFSYPGTILDSFLNEKNKNKVFMGYVFTLQFLWYKLLGKNEFKKCPVSELNTVIKFQEDKKSIQKSNLFFPKYSSASNNLRNEWHELDNFFTKIRDEVIKIKVPPSIENSRLLLSGEFKNSCLEPLMKLSKIDEPDYLIKQKSFESFVKMLDAFFFWHEMDLLDTNKIHVFNGAFAFISLLLGEVERYRLSNLNDIIWIARIKHPVSKKYNDISYGILLQSGGFISDTSGWIIFLNCGDDCSGNSKHICLQVEEFIKKFEEDNKIKVKEISIDSEVFVRYLREKNIPSLIQHIKFVTNELIENTELTYESPDPESLILHNLQNIKDDNIADISTQIEKILFFLKFFVPDEPKYNSINKKLDQIAETKDIAEKLELIATIIPLIPYIVENDKIESIESKLDDLIVKIDPKITSKIIISTGVEIAGSGLKRQLEIPLSSISYKEISDDLKELMKHPNKPLKKFPKLKKKISDYMISNNSEALSEK